jgi:hypothetical protein
MDAAYSPKTLVPIYQTTQCQIQNTIIFIAAAVGTPISNLKEKYIS